MQRSLRPCPLPRGLGTDGTSGAWTAGLPGRPSRAHTGVRGAVCPLCPRSTSAPETHTHPALGGVCAASLLRSPQSSVRLLEFRVSLEVTCVSFLSSSLTLSWGVSTSGLPVPRECLVTVSFWGWWARLCGERSPGRGPGRGLLSRGSSQRARSESQGARAPFLVFCGDRSLQSIPGCVNGIYGTLLS